MRPVLAPTRDNDGLCARVNAVLDELGDCLQRIALRERNDPDRVPVVSDLELTAIELLGCHRASRWLSRRAKVPWGLKHRIRFHAASASLTRFPPLTARVTSMSRLNFSHFPFMRSDTRD
jgi:hypothetical protein